MLAASPRQFRTVAFLTFEETRIIVLHFVASAHRFHQSMIASVVVAAACGPDLEDRVGAYGVGEGARLRVRLKVRAAHRIVYLRALLRAAACVRQLQPWFAAGGLVQFALVAVRTTVGTAYRFPLPVANFWAVFLQQSGGTWHLQGPFIVLSRF